jgi:dTDP-4-amino-4,6-dideoxygalactose transaminase
MKPYTIVDAFEERVAEYAGAKYGVGVNSCTSAIMLSAKYRFMHRYHTRAYLPSRTYVGVPNAIIAAGGEVNFKDFQWSGWYQILPLGIIDSARRFRKGMYKDGTLYCISFHWGKHLKIGTGGMVLTDDEEAWKELKRLRHDGRTPTIHPKRDTIGFGWHVGMAPEDAAKGLMLMQYMPDYNEDIPWDDYPDCSRIFL